MDFGWLGTGERADVSVGIDNRQGTGNYKAVSIVPSTILCLPAFVLVEF